SGRSRDGYGPSPTRAWASEGSCSGACELSRLLQGSDECETGGPVRSLGMSQTNPERWYSDGACCDVSIRIASLGHASTHSPQTMHRSSSITNWVGCFSITREGAAGSAGPYSPPSIYIPSPGQPPPPIYQPTHP